jgi:hypothetical protein
MASNGVMEAIRFDAEVRQVKSLVDKSWNIVLNVPEYNIDQVKRMMDLMNDMVAVAMVRADGETD